MKIATSRDILNSQMAPKNPAERVRDRIRAWMDLAKLSQRDVAKEMRRSQPWVVAVVTGQNDVRLRDLDDVAAALRTTASELVRDEDERHTLELTPSEVQVIERARRRPEAFAAICALLDVPKPPPLPERATERPRRTISAGRKARSDDRAPVVSES